MSKSKIKITEFKNPAGSKAWKLSGNLNGRRIRENYKTRAAAVEQRQEYDIEFLNQLSDGQTVEDGVFALFYKLNLL